MEKVDVKETCNFYLFYLTFTQIAKKTKTN